MEINFSTTIALSGAECAGKSWVCGGRVAPSAQMEGLCPSRPPRRLYRCELSGFVPPACSRKLIPVIPAAFFLDEIPFCFRLFGNIQLVEQ
jgi:hypothetical protein